MSRIDLDKPARDRLAGLLADHLRSELDADIDPVDGLRLLDFLSETLGPHFYNQGLHDARAVIQDRADSIIEAVYALEKPVKR